MLFLYTLHVTIVQFLGLKKSLFNVFQFANCHPKMALVIDDRLKVWDEKDQPRVHVVPAFAPYYSPQAEVHTLTHPLFFIYIHFLFPLLFLICHNVMVKWNELSSRPIMLSQFSVLREM